MPRWLFRVLPEWVLPSLSALIYSGGLRNKSCRQYFIPGTDVIIELGGEDAKILFLTNGLEVRMNGTCAGGTGAFIDQMATLLNVKLEDMDELAKQHEKTYTIASRCGVFAKTDIQPLLNQGARKSDIAESISMRL